jgi:small acid-soluble spore protein A (major alpha-type SASP)
MAQGNQTDNRVLVSGAEKALERFKYEIASELGLGNQVRNGYWGDIPARQCGAVGGAMVKRMIALAEQQLAGSSGKTAR